MTFELYWKLKLYGMAFSLAVLIILLVWQYIDEKRKKK